MLLEVLTGDLTFTSLKPPDLSSCTKQDLMECFENSYNLNESLFTALKDVSVMYKCPDRLRLPLLFYYGHTAVVYVNKLILAGLLKDRVNLEYETIFETGVDEMAWDDTENYRMGGSYRWPSLDSVVDYRRTVRNIILNVIQDTPLSLPITMESPWWSVVMGIEHERIHVETSSVLIRQLPVDMVTRPNGWKYAPLKTGTPQCGNPMIRIEGREVTYGKPKDFPSYGWDNEYGQVTSHVAAFEASKFLVTNKEFLAFVQTGGYSRQELWSREGWDWRTFKQARHPVFWVCDQEILSECKRSASLLGSKLCTHWIMISPLTPKELECSIVGYPRSVAPTLVNLGCKSGCGSDLSAYSHCRLGGKGELQLDGSNSNNAVYTYRAMFDELEMPWPWPAEVNYHEASAFCIWKGEGYRLPTEAEYAALRETRTSVSSGVECDVIYTSNRSTDTVNHNLKFGSPTPVDWYPADERGFHDVYGNVWQWTEDQFNGLSGETHWLYDDYSSNLYDGKHNLMLGGSWIASGNWASAFVRNTFRRHFFQHTGFRLARTARSSNNQLGGPLTVVDIQEVGVGNTYVRVNQSSMQFRTVASTNKQYRYETAEALTANLRLEYGSRNAFPAVVANMCKNTVEQHKVNTGSAIWIGSGSGRGPFILSETFDKVLAIEYSGRFMDTAERIQKGDVVTFDMTGGQCGTASLEPTNLPENVIFKQMTWLPNEVGTHDLVILTLLERVNNPKAWQVRLWELTRPGGLCVIACPEGSWDRQALQPTLSERSMTCLAEEKVPFDSETGNRRATLTVWRHR